MKLQKKQEKCKKKYEISKDKINKCKQELDNCKKTCSIDYNIFKQLIVNINEDIIVSLEQYLKDNDGKNDTNNKIQNFIFKKLEFVNKLTCIYIIDYYEGDIYDVIADCIINKRYNIDNVSKEDFYKFIATQVLIKQNNTNIRKILLNL